MVRIEYYERRSRKDRRQEQRRVEQNRRKKAAGVEGQRRENVDRRSSMSEDIDGPQAQADSSGET